MSSTDHDASDFGNAPFGAIRSQEQMGSIDNLLTFWSKAQSLLRPHG